VKDDIVSLIDISEKKATLREALAESLLRMPAWLIEAFTAGEVMSKKGPIIHTANLAGIMAAKNTSSLIPLTHALTLTHVALFIKVVDCETIRIECQVRSLGPTGVEMEALTGASIAALTIYDMCKSMTNTMEIISTKLIKKSGGKHDFDHKRPG
jgi:cyclic pyranopterin phosphate synthase